MSLAVVTEEEKEEEPDTSEEYPLSRAAGEEGRQEKENEEELQCESVAPVGLRPGTAPQGARRPETAAEAGASGTLLGRRESDSQSAPLSPT